MPAPQRVWCPDCEAIPGRACRTDVLGLARLPHEERKAAARAATEAGADPAEVECGFCGASVREPCAKLPPSHVYHGPRLRDAAERAEAEPSP